eukprot:TRINITY_DN26704_c0_g1_i1.p1 TRINITY_DN26704_c0_g1~~TRINITY_DN26704_c0_g1_i1.p1  ORF type:complete len:251 (-),score=73.08 TRINITY_DN26704_c0_g1_i1:89-784(-)
MPSSGLLIHFGVFLSLFCFRLSSGVVGPLPSTWDVLAPFPLGTRERGGDPLEAFGGIWRIPRADSSTYPSDIINGAKVGWTTVAADASDASVSVAFNASVVDWPLIEAWAGAAGAMFQGWALGDFTVSTAASYLVGCAGVNVFYIDGQQFNGDGYGAGWALSPVALTAGTHTFTVPFYGSETGGFGCSLAPLDTDLRLVGDVSPAAASSRPPLVVVLLFLLFLDRVVWYRC